MSIKNFNNINEKELNKIIKNISKKINLFSGNCGVFAIGLANFLKKIGNYDLNYIIYSNVDEEYIEEIGHDIEVYNESDIYHVVLSVKGNGIDNIFDGNGVCTKKNIEDILEEYGENLKTSGVFMWSINTPKIENIIRWNTNYNIFSDIIFELLLKEYYGE